MKQIGISYYPDFYDDATCKKMLDQANELGYEVIFTSLILNDYGFSNTVAGISAQTKFFLNYAAEIGMEVHADITRKILVQLGGSVEDLSAIDKLNIPVLRLDGGFSDDEVVALTKNKHGIKIEENLSNYRQLADRLEQVDEEGNIDQYLACHNFYPRTDTGLTLTDAVAAAKMFQSFDVRTGIFIGSLSSKNDLNATGQSTMTVENHRYLPPEIQATELLGTEMFDYVIFGDSHPHEKELETVSQVFKDFTKNERPILSIPVYLEEVADEIKTTLLNTTFSNRVDVPDKVIRGTQTRGKLSVEKANIFARTKGAITIDNQLSDRYEGELHIMLEDLPPANYANVVGYVKPYALHLLPLLKNPEIDYRLEL